MLSKVMMCLDIVFTDQVHHEDVVNKIGGIGLCKSSFSAVNYSVTRPLF